MSGQGSSSGAYTVSGDLLKAIEKKIEELEINDKRQKDNITFLMADLERVKRENYNLAHAKNELTEQLKDMEREAKNEIRKLAKEQKEYRQRVEADKVFDLKMIGAQLANYQEVQQLQMDTHKHLALYHNKRFCDVGNHLKYGDKEQNYEIQQRLNMMSEKNTIFKFGTQVMKAITILPHRAGAVRGPNDELLSDVFHLAPTTPLVFWYGVQIPYTWIEKIEEANNKE